MMGRIMSNCARCSSYFVRAHDVRGDKIKVTVTERGCIENLERRYSRSHDAVMGSSPSTATIHMLRLWDGDICLKEEDPELHETKYGMD